MLSKNRLLLAGAGGALADPAKELLEISLRNTDRLIRLVNDLLDLSRLEAGRMELNLEPVALGEAIATSVEALAAFATEQQVTITTAPPAADVRILGAPDRVEQVVVNLLSNAIKFSPAGSRVTVRWWPDGDEADVHVQAVTRSDHVPQQTTVPVDLVGRGLGHESHEGAGRQESLRDRGGLRPVALGLEVHLGRVDLHQPDTLAGRQVDRVPVGHARDPVQGRSRGGGTPSRRRQGDEHANGTQPNRATPSHVPQGHHAGLSWGHRSRRR